MTEPRTITDHKAAFIRAQVRQLSTPLSPSPAWNSDLFHNSDSKTSTTEGSTRQEKPITDKTLEEILNKLNNRIKSHNRNVFATQSQRHVAEQIDALYWNEISAENIQADADTIWVRRNFDLSETDAAQALPSSYRDLFLFPPSVDEDDQTVRGDSQESDMKRMEEAEYLRLRGELMEVTIQRDEYKARLSMYQQLNGLLKPFENAREFIQPNLITKDGELNQELNKMKVLIARVAARIGQMSSIPTLDEDQSVGQQQSNRDKLDHVFELG